MDIFASLLTAHKAVPTIAFLSEKIKSIEKYALEVTSLKPEFKCLLTMPGIGSVLGLTIMLEVGTIHRFPSAGNFASYCRCVKSDHFSNGRKKGCGNRKNGNRYLSWAFMEDANFAIRFNPKAKRFYDKKRSKTNATVARKALANKMARATYHMMKNQTNYEQKRMFN